MGVIRVPLHLISLHSDIVSGTVAVGLRASLSVKGISMILGNDRVIGDAQISDVPCLATENEAIEDLFPSCAVTRAMAKAAEAPQVNSTRKIFQYHSRE